MKNQREKDPFYGFMIEVPKNELVDELWSNKGFKAYFATYKKVEELIKLFKKDTGREIVEWEGTIFENSKKFEKKLAELLEDPYYEVASMNE